ncbi:sensor histidine kinase [Parachryseolinea silvisoli]|uniref:sensor histidine kinase n=1 Tax=Parachryseolinea silvisoli TaxID=2873601 RepID=UPI002265D93C|nr:HAMP domain-containing sensor histidine kinase [Parachryseolinea silvisoli]MCD9016769.1 HAMP domain-containing histidine kinase [Parachryseolinea silvisoli]
MSLKKRVRNIIIGEDRYIESWGEYKQVMLSGHFALIGILLCLVYMLFDFSSGNYVSIPVFATSIFFLALSVFIHRQGDHGLANYFMLPTLNITVYLFSASESPNTGAFMFFIVVAVAAFAVFNYKERLVSILFAVFTYILFALAYFIDFSIMPKRAYTEEMLLFHVVVNFTVALPATTMGVYLLISLNHYNAIQLVQSNEMLTKTNSELDRFVYSTSHDLRAPLSSVLGLINIADRTENPQDVKRYLSMMKERVHSLDKFIRDITDYSRNNRLEIVREKVNLSEMAHEIWDSLKFAPEAERINFQVEIPQDAIVESDKNRLRVIMGNLISNAIRYHDLAKAERFIRLQHQMNGKVFYLRVEDNGQGIAPEYHTRIYDMFYRGNEQSKGSGLGLYIVKEALVKLSGSIHLESAPGKGSIFTVKLPKR